MTPVEFIQGLFRLCQTDDEKVNLANALRNVITDECPIKQPIDFVQWLKIDQVQPNDYNPNSVASVEMGLLYRSIKHDGYTQPIVAISDPEKGKAVIIDGFHRYYVGKMNKDISASTLGYLPVVILKKDINERMAATVRHNRARGEHSVDGMGSLVFSMLDNGMSESEICNELGMEPEEILKLKHITGFSKLFEDIEYKQAWVTNKQLKLKKEAGL